MKRTMRLTLILSLFAQLSYAQTQATVQTVEEYEVLFNTLVERIHATKANVGLYVGRSFNHFVNYLNENDLQITRTSFMVRQQAYSHQREAVGIGLWFLTTENTYFAHINELSEPLINVEFHVGKPLSLVDSIMRIHKGVFTEGMQEFYADAIVSRIVYRTPTSIFDPMILANLNSYVVSARRITRIVTDEMGTRNPLTVSEAQERFEDDPFPSRGWGNITIPTGNDSFWNRNVESIAVVPDWSVAVERTDTSRDIVELPWRYEDDIKKPIALLPVWEYFQEKGMIPPSVDKMLILRDVGNRNIWILRMQILPDLDYILNHGDRLHTNTYFHRCRYLSGLVIFSDSGGFVIGWRMRQGRVTGELRHNHLGTIRTERLPLLKNDRDMYLGTDEEDDVVLTLFREGFMSVRSYRYAQ